MSSVDMTAPSHSPTTCVCQLWRERCGHCDCTNTTEQPPATTGGFHSSFGPPVYSDTQVESAAELGQTWSYHRDHGFHTIEASNKLPSAMHWSRCCSDNFDSYPDTDTLHLGSLVISYQQKFTIQQQRCSGGGEETHYLHYINEKYLNLHNSL